MRSLFRLALPLALAFAAGQAASSAAERPSAETAGHGARAEVMRAAVKGEVLTVELRFEALTEPFGGEIVYAALDREAVFVEAGGERFPLVADEGAAPAELRLNFSYDLAKTPRVGRWTGRFVAPPASVRQIDLHVSGLPEIEHITIER